jgi:hypothetical protein
MGCLHRRAFARSVIGIAVLALMIGAAAPRRATAAIDTSVRPSSPYMSSQAFNDTNTTWSGISVHTTGTAVQAQWIEPPVKCGGGPTYGAIWVGIGGDGSNTVEQTGTQETCDDGRVWVDGWYEMYPHPAHGVPGVHIVKPGDRMMAIVSYKGPALFRLQLKNLSRGWAATEQLSAPNASRLSVEVIIETPKSDTPNLNHFGTVTFTHVAVNHRSLGYWDKAMRRYNLEAGNGKLEDTTSTPSKSSFNIKWGG